MLTARLAHRIGLDGLMLPDCEYELFVWQHKSENTLYQVTYVDPCGWYYGSVIIRLFVCEIAKQEVDGRPLRLNMAAERARTGVSSPAASEATAQDTDSSEVVSPPASETTTDNTDSSELVSPPASDTTTEDRDSGELVSSVSI